MIHYTPYTTSRKYILDFHGLLCKVGTFLQQWNGTKEDEAVNRILGAQKGISVSLDLNLCGKINPDTEKHEHELELELEKYNNMFPATTSPCSVTEELDSREHVLCVFLRKLLTQYPLKENNDIAKSTIDARDRARDQNVDEHVCRLMSEMDRFYELGSSKPSIQ